MESNKALVFHIIHGSFVDGYGIRTTVFLKGCPLKCIWCCNPEGQSYKPELKVTRDLCNGCGGCLDSCSKKALTLNEGRLTVDRKICDGCMDCIDYCYTGALDSFGKMMSAREVFEIIEKDKKFYETTGGGATIGGGECTNFADFMIELIDLCHEANISVNVDTCGLTLSEKAVDVLKKADMLLFDIKGIDPEEHKKNTGMSNEIILKNLRLMGEIGKPLIIRIPVIPEYNDSDENLTSIANLLCEIKSVERIDILPLHEFGKIKYDELDMEYKLNSHPVSEERQLQIKKMFEDRGFNTQLGG